MPSRATLSVCLPATTIGLALLDEVWDRAVRAKRATDEIARPVGAIQSGRRRSEAGRFPTGSHAA